MIAKLVVILSLLPVMGGSPIFASLILGFGSSVYAIDPATGNVSVYAPGIGSINGVIQGPPGLFYLTTGVNLYAINLVGTRVEVGEGVIGNDIASIPGAGFYAAYGSGIYSYFPGCLPTPCPNNGTLVATLPSTTSVIEAVGMDLFAVSTYGVHTVSLVNPLSGKVTTVGAADGIPTFDSVISLAYDPDTASLIADVAIGAPSPVSYTHLTLPTNREV